MNPAPSVIIFTVLSGLGFGFMAFLAVDALAVSGFAALVTWAIGYALAGGGLLASTFHLGNPQRALLAFTQWRTSWLSREAWASVATLLMLAPVALSDWFGLGLPAGFGYLAAALCVVTVLCTAMIYTQIRAVPRWNHPLTPLLFLAFAAAGGATLSGQVVAAAGLTLVLLALLLASFVVGDRQFAARGATLAEATGLGAIGAPSVFELPHTGGNYLMREMIHVVGRRHATKLRRIAIGLIALALLLLILLPIHLGILLATLTHLAGAFVARWLFFAQAEHVVGLYYGQRG
jgi:sulfite dehydrogenase (quinone) subunit SoeC